MARLLMLCAGFILLARTVWAARPLVIFLPVISLPVITLLEAMTSSHQRALKKFASANFLFYVSIKAGVTTA